MVTFERETQHEGRLPVIAHTSLSTPLHYNDVFWTWAQLTSMDLRGPPTLSPSRRKKLRRLDSLYCTEDAIIDCSRTVSIHNLSHICDDERRCREAAIIVSDWRASSRQLAELSVLTPHVVVGKNARLTFCVERATNTAVALVVSESEGDRLSITAFMQRRIVLKGNPNGALDHLIHHVLRRAHESGIKSATFGTQPRPDGLLNDPITSLGFSILSRTLEKMSHLMYNADGLHQKKKNWASDYRTQTLEIRATIPRAGHVTMFAACLRILVACGFSLPRLRTIKPTRTLVVGAGYSGIAQCARMKREGSEVLIVEKSSSIGGCWVTDANDWSATESPSFLYLSPLPRTRRVSLSSTATRSHVIATLSACAPDDVRTNVKVTHVRRDTCGMYTVDFQLTDGRIVHGVFDDVVWCDGVARELYIPEWHTRHCFAASAQIPHMRMPRYRHADTVCIIGNGSFAMEALDHICTHWTVERVVLVARHRKWIFDKRLLACNYLLLVTPMPQWFRYLLLRAAYGRHTMVPANVQEMLRMYTASASSSLYCDERVEVIIGDAVGAAELPNDKTRVVIKCDSRVEDVNIDADTVVLATGRRPHPETEYGLAWSERTTACDVVNGLGVWAHALGFGIHNCQGTRLPHVSTWPRTAHDMCDRFLCSWRTSSAIVRTRLVLHFLIQYNRLVVASVTEMMSYCFPS